MCGRPNCSTDIAKLISAFTGHVVAALVLFDHELALNTLAIMQITLEKLHLVLVAFSLMLGQKALSAKLRLTFVADHHVFKCCPDHSLTIFLGTELYVRVFCCLVKIMKPCVAFLDICRQLLEEIGVGVDNSWAFFTRTAYFLEYFYLIDDVVVEAGFTEIEFVVTIAHPQLRV